MPNLIKVAILGDARSLQEASGKAVKSLGQVEGKTTSTSQKLAAVGTKLAAGLATVAAAAVGFAVKQGAELQESTDNLQNALKTQGGSLASFGDKYKPLLAANEKWGNSNATVNASLEKLVRAGVPAKKALTDEAIAANLAASRHISLASATDILAKVETGHVSLLGRLGIQTKDASGKTLSQAAALKLLSAKYKDAAKDAGETFAGKLKAAKVQVEDIAARIGVRLIPILEKLGVDVGAVVQWLEKHRAVMIAVGVVVGTIVAGLITYAAVTKAIEIGTKLWTVATKAAEAAQWLLNAALDANPITIAVAAVALLAVGLYELYKHFSPVRTAVDDVWGALKTAFNWVRSNWPLLLAILTGPIGAAVYLIAKYWSAISGGAKTAFDDVVDFAKGLPGRLLGYITSIGSAAAHLGSAILNGIVSGLSGVLGTIGNIGEAIANSIGRVINVVINDFKGGIRTLANALANINVPGVGRAFDAASSALNTVANHIPTIPKFHAGGVFNSGQGEGLALLQDGERVLSRSQTANYDRPTQHVTNHFNFPAGVDPNAAVRAQRRWERINGRAA